MVDALDDMDSALGILPHYEIAGEARTAAEERRILRSKKDWPGADKKRAAVRQLGYNIIDINDTNYALVKRREYGE